MEKIRKINTGFLKIIRLVVLLHILIITNVTKSQPVFSWANQIGDAANQESFSITVDSSGNSYSLGIFSGTLDFDPSAASFNLTTANGFSNAFICKLNSSGAFVWAKQIAGVGFNDNVFPDEIKLDNNGDLYVVGTFSGTVDFDLGPGVANLTATSGIGGNNESIFILKLNSNGNFIWVKAINPKDGNFPNVFPFVNVMDIDFDINNNVFVVGQYQETIDFGGGDTLTASAVNFYVLKLSSSGSNLWAKSPQKNETPTTWQPLNTPGGVDIDVSGNVLITGSFRGTIDFDMDGGVSNLTSTGPSSSSFPDLFVLKLNNNGNFLWVKQIGNSTTESEGKEIESDAAGNILIIAHLRRGNSGNIDLDPNSGIANMTLSAGAFNSVIVKFDAIGNYIWAKNIATSVSSTLQTESFNLALDCNNNVFSVGRFMGGVADFDPGSGIFNMTPNFQDIFISELDVSGNFVWAGQFGIGSSFSTIYDIDIDGNNSIYFTGGFGNGNISTPTMPSNDFDPGIGTFNLTAQGFNDVFVAKLTTITIPVVTLVASQQSICSGSATTITASGATNYLWSPSTGLSSTVGTSVIANPTISTTYTVVGSNGGTCSATDSSSITITVSPTSMLTQNPTICQGDSIVVGANIYTITGTFIDTLTNFLGCDSIITTNLTVNPIAFSTDTITSCTSITWIDGLTYAASTNTPTFTLVGGSSQGCDSVVTLNLTINPTTTGTDVRNTCNTFTWIDGITYTASTNTPTFILTNSSGCDSIVTLDLTINNTVTNTDVQTACNSFTWIDGITYTTSTNLPTVTLIGGAASGCDSIISLNLTINTPIKTTNILNECQGFSVTVGTNTYTTTGVFIDVINNCDTIVTNLTINPAPQFNLVKTDALCFEETGTASATITSATFPVNYSWSTGGTDSIITNLAEGVYMLTLIDSNGCSSIKSIEILNEQKDCDFFVYLPNAFTPNGDGNNDVFFVNGKGIVSMNLKIYNRWGNKVFETTDQTQVWDGQYKGKNQDTGTFMYVLEAAFVNGKTINQSGDISLIR